MGERLCYGIGVVIDREGAVIAIIWRYRVAPASERQFEQAYGSDGDWAKLFGEAEGYIRTELLRGGDGDYLTIDYWLGADAWEAFSAPGRGISRARCPLRCAHRGGGTDWPVHRRAWPQLSRAAGKNLIRADAIERGLGYSLG